jgi:hypothetical protein
LLDEQVVVAALAGATCNIKRLQNTFKRLARLLQSRAKTQVRAGVCRNLQSAEQPVLEFLNNTVYGG